MWWRLLLAEGLWRTEEIMRGPCQICSLLKLKRNWLLDFCYKRNYEKFRKNSFHGNVFVCEKFHENVDLQTFFRKIFTKMFVFKLNFSKMFAKIWNFREKTSFTNIVSQSSPDRPIMAVLPWLSRTCSPIPAVLPMLLCSGRLVLSSCTGFIVLTKLSGCRVPAVLSQLLVSRFSCLSNFVPSSCPHCSLLAVMFWTSCLICPVPA